MSVVCISSSANKKEGVSTTPEVGASPALSKMSSDTLRTAVEAGYKIQGQWASSVKAKSTVPRKGWCNPATTCSGSADRRS